MKPKTNGHKRRTPKPRTPLLLWINPEKRKEKDARMFLLRNKYLYAFVISALYLLSSLTLTKTADNDLVIGVLTFGLGWLAGWTSRTIIQWRR